MRTRIMHHLERQYLTLRAQGLLHRYILAGELDHGSAEEVLNQVILIGSTRNAPLDEFQIMDLVAQMQESKLFTTGKKSYESDGNTYLIN